MRCPFCGAPDTEVIDSRPAGEGSQIRRRRACPQCADRFTTYESAELVMPRIIKRDNRRSPFQEEKLRAGIAKALEKRPVSVEQIEAAIGRIMHRLRASGEREVSSHALGQWVMEELSTLDEVAYVRYASVYRRFQDVNAFREEIKRLESKQALQATASESHENAS